MAGSTFGNRISVTTWGESHGKALGVVVDGFPAGLKLSEEDIQPYLIEESLVSLNIRLLGRRVMRLLFCREFLKVLLQELQFL